MPGIAYVNGSYRPLAAASVNVEDRGLQFGDGVYEVFYVHEGRLIDRERHLARLRRSLGELGITMPVAESALPVIVAALIRRNRTPEGLAYVQVTRGVARRDHVFPTPAPRPSLVVTLRAKPKLPRDAAAWAAAAITWPDQRWGRCDIKSLNLLPNVLAREAARQAGAAEAILYTPDGAVTEAAASNVWIVDAEGTLRTRQLDRHILPGCTRAAVLERLDDVGAPFREGGFSVAELRQAREVFLTGATSFVRPITRLDGAPVANGHPGGVTTALFGRYLAGFETAGV